MLLEKTLLELSERFDPKIRSIGIYEFLRPVSRIRCIDGFSMSAQSGMLVRCMPRDNVGPWSHVEVGCLSDEEPMLDIYKSGDIYNYVPIEIVGRIIIKHGGLLPELVEDNKVIEGEVISEAELIEHNPLDGLFQKRISLKS